MPRETMNGRNDDAQSHKVGDIGEAVVLVAFLHQFVGQRRLGLHTMLDGIQLDALLLQRVAEVGIDLVRQLQQLWTQLVELVEQPLAMW